LSKKSATATSNVFRVDFARGRKSFEEPVTPSYVDYSDRETASIRPPKTEVTNLSVVRDEVLGARFKEIAGIAHKDGKISAIIAIQGDAAPDARWCRQLVCTIDDTASKFKCGSPVMALRPSETGKFIHLVTQEIKGVRPTPMNISPNTVFRIAGPRGWKLEARFSELSWCKIEP